MKRNIGRLEGWNEWAVPNIPVFHHSIIPFLILLFFFSPLLRRGAGGEVSAQTVTTFTTTGAGTFVVPCNVTSIVVECWGGGGQGGGDANTSTAISGSGGGGGGYCTATITVTPGQNIAYTVGAGGSGGGNGAVGLGGGNTNFSTVIANGGGGGQINNGPGGTGGGGSGGTVIMGAAGQVGNSTPNFSGSGGLAGNQATGNGSGSSTDGAGNPGAAATGGGGAGAQHLSAGSNAGGAGGSGKIKLTYTQAGLSGTYTIGPTGTYTTIAAAKAALACTPISGPVIFEFQTTYTDASETYPLVFNAIPGASAVNTVTFRPTAGASNIVLDGDPGNSATFIDLVGVQYLIFDGRPGGAGSVGQLTIRNTRITNTIGPVVYFSNDASNNAFRYVTIEGEPASSFSIIFFSTTTGTTGNDNNTFSFCTIRDRTDGLGTAAYPTTGIYALGTLGKSNSGNQVDNCMFIDIFNPSAALSSAMEIEANNDSWTITGNHVYQGASNYANLSTNPWSGIYIGGGGGHTVTGNFIGGRAPNCGGTAFTVTSGTSQFQGIRFIGTTGAACTVSGNTVSNISYISTGTTANQWCLIGLAISGGTNYTIGSSGNGNTIGNMGSVGDIMLTNNSAGAFGIAGITCNFTGTGSIAYNNIGGITVNGTSGGLETDLIYVNTATATLTFDNNTIGGTVSNSIIINSPSPLYGLYNGGTPNGITFTNNTVQNISHAGGTTTLGGVYNATGPLIATGNIFRNIYSSSSATASQAIFMIDHQPSTAATATVSSNTIQDIGLTSTTTGYSFYAISLNAAAAITCNNNTIGGATANNISIAGTANSFGIYRSLAGSFTCVGNTIQNFNMSNAATTTSFTGINNIGAAMVCSTNVIKNITGAGNGNYNMINHAPAAAGVGDIFYNTFQDISLTNTGANALFFGIRINSSSGTFSNFNTIGSTAANNIVIAGNGKSDGILKSGTGNLTCSGNQIQQIYLTNTGANAIFRGIEHTSGVLNCVNNTIQNIKIDAQAATLLVNIGILSTSASAGHTLNQNTIKNLSATTTAPIGMGVAGIYAQTGSGTLTRNWVSGLSNLSTAGNADITGIQAASGSWNIYNNIIILSNESNTNDLVIYGLEENEPTGTTNVYHNTVSIGGSIASGSASSYAFYRGGTGTDNVKNNLFQNLRSGGGGPHHAEFAVAGGTYSTDYNYLEVSANQNHLGNLGGAYHNFTSWKTAVSAPNDLNGTTALNAVGSAPPSFVGANAGTDLFTPLTVTLDYLGNSRDVNPWMGAYEGSLSITTDPISPTTVCRGGTVTITYVASGTFNAGNIFKAELSDAAGSFTTTVTAIGSVTATVSTPITATIPIGTAPGTQYRIRVVSSNPATNGSDNGTDLIVPADGGTGTWTWTGAVSTNWFDRCNWDKKCLPDASSDVVIPANKTALITAAQANCNTITIDSDNLGRVIIDTDNSGRLVITQ